MINQIQHDANFLLATNFVATDQNINKKKITTNVNIITESNLAIAHTSTPNNESLNHGLMQRTIGPTNTDLISSIRKKIEDEIANSPEFTVYFIPNIDARNKPIRFTEVAKNNMSKAGISSEELNDAIKISNETHFFGKFYNPRFYVNNLKINHYLKNFFLENKDHCNIFEFFYGPGNNKKIWTPVKIINHNIINEVMLNPKYIKTSNKHPEKLIADTERFITDKIIHEMSQYLSATTNILIKELFSEKKPEEKIEDLQAIVYPDYLLSNDSSQEKTPLLSAECFLHHIQFSPYSNFVE